jgi:hypothetical protein
VIVPETPSNTFDRLLAPMLLLKVPGPEGEELTLCDFASAGASGTRYRSWLPGTNLPPPPVVTRSPRDGATIPMGTVRFRWAGTPAANETRLLEISGDEFFAEPLVQQAVPGREALVEVGSVFRTDRPYWWRIVSSNRFGSTRSSQPAAFFRVNASLPKASDTLATPRPAGGEIVSWPATNRVNGSQKIVFAAGEWPDDYAVRFRFRLLAYPTNRIGQIFSAWAAPMDDPLRLTIESGKLFGRIEAGAHHSTEGIPIELNRWHDLKAIKVGGRLRVFLDGAERASCAAPEYIWTRARDFALGGNPLYSGNEFVEADFSQLVFSDQSN